jgi:hypothetical protein
VGGNSWRKTVGGGPLLFGNKSNASEVLNGPSWSFNAQLSTFIGFQVIWNSSGILGGLRRA